MRGAGSVRPRRCSQEVRTGALRFLMAMASAKACHPEMTVAATMTEAELPVPIRHPRSSIVYTTLILINQQRAVHFFARSKAIAAAAMAEQMSCTVTTALARYLSSYNIGAISSRPTLMIIWANAQVIVSVFMFPFLRCTAAPRFFCKKKCCNMIYYTTNYIKCQ